MSGLHFEGLKVLVLSRKVGESVLLHLRDGRTVDVKITDIRTSRLPRVHLGISAPEDVLILREEVPVHGIKVVREKPA